MAVTRSIASGAATGLTTTFGIIALATVPDSCILSLLHGEITTIAGGATSVVWYLANDAAGDVPFTDQITTTIVVGATTATKGGVAELVGVEWFRPGSTLGTLYLVAKTNAGTCTMTPRVWCRVDT